MKVVIVDSGVDATHPIFQGKTINGAAVRFFNNQLHYDNNFSDQNGHGTAVMGIIAKEAPACDLYVLKVFDEESELGVDSLVAILTYIYENIECDVINLSLGISQIEDSTELERICKVITSKGTILVSAFENAGAVSYPAAFPCVVGVTSGMYCNNVHVFEYVDDIAVNICAYGKTQRLAWTNRSYIMLGGNSMACAHVTAQILNFKERNETSSFSDILQQFKGVAIKCHVMQDGTHASIPFSIEKAILFPFNKEMHSLIRSADQLDFDIIGVYDTKYSGNVGMCVHQVLKNWEQTTSQLIQNIHSIPWDKFDTLILGHVDKLSQFSQITRDIEQLIEKMIFYGRNIYVLDTKIAAELKLAEYPLFYSPEVKKENLPANRFGKLHRSSKPVLGVFGTSSSQGKFTLQLILREIFLALGYQIGQIGTEPQSLLFGIDYTYPMGYSSSVEIDGMDSIRYLNFLMQKLSTPENDIIIVGSQSGTVPYDYGNIVQYPLPQSLFLLGTLPDIVCLSINSFDEDDYIRRTINYIESVSNSKVLALVLYPMGIVDNWRSIYAAKRSLTQEELDYHKTRLTSLFHLPIYTLGVVDDMNALFDCILEYFDEEESV